MADDEFESVRRTVIIAMFSDDVLYEKLVVKGGNALRLVHGIGPRVSLDLDFSTEGELDEEDTARRIERSLEDRFETLRLRVFDFKFARRPAVVQDQRFAGYQAVFKLMPEDRAAILRRDIARGRREALVVGHNQERTFTIDISSNEFCEASEVVDFDLFKIRVYSPAMIAIEKYRALCQQSDRYEARPRKAQRARDFLDIHSIVTSRMIDLTTPENRELFHRIFEAKLVPLDLLADIPLYREFHRENWPSVVHSARANLRPFDEYFDFVVEQIKAL